VTSTLKATFLLAIISLTASFAHAQSADLTHIFPQFVDGMGGDGSVWTSRFVIASIGGLPAACNISLFGIGLERLTASASVVVQPLSWEAISSRGRDVLATGYARLDCSQPVFASLTYSLQSGNGAPVGIATVPGAPIAGGALIPMLLNAGYRYGIAMANDNDAVQLVVLLFESGATSLVRTIQLQPRSQYVAFVDEIFNVPTAGLGTLKIGAVPGGGPGNFHIVALLCDQSGFTNVVPAVTR
jgi:hypothetical protein